MYGDILLNRGHMDRIFFFFSEGRGKNICMHEDRTLTTEKWLKYLRPVLGVSWASGSRRYKDLTGFPLFTSQGLLALLSVVIKDRTVNHTVAEVENNPTRGCKPQ